MSTLHLLDQLDAVLESDESKVEGIKVMFAEELARTLSRKSMSRNELAEKMSVSLPYISKILKGDANLSLKSIVKICSAIGSEINISIKEPNDQILGSEWAQMVEKRNDTKIKNQHHRPKNNAHEKWEKWETLNVSKTYQEKCATC